jgi:hypothetical protein
LFLPDFGIEKDVEQDITQFFADISGIAGQQGFAEFIGFLDGKRPQAFVGLFPCPRDISPQFVKDIREGDRMRPVWLRGVCIVDVLPG